MNNPLFLKTADLKNLIDKFAYAVKKEKYGRLPYDMWKDLTKLEYEHTTSNIIITKSNNSIHIANSNRGICVCVNDNSFGSYIDDHWDDITNELEDAFKNKIMASPCSITTYNPASEVCYCSTSVDCDSSIKDYIDKLIYDYNGKESEDNNIMNTFNFDFGPITNNQVHLSPYGMAIKNSQGTWVAYNGSDVIDVDIFNFDAKKFLYKMPVAIKDIAVGDVVIHNRLPMFVIDVKEGIKVVDVYSGEKKEILLTKNMFGFDFATKVVSILDFSKSATAASADNPFGSMLPFFLLSNEADMDPMTLLLLTANNGVMGNSTMDFSNPFMIMALMGDKNNKNDMLLPLLLMNQQKPAPTLPPVSNP